MEVNRENLAAGSKVTVVGSSEVILNSATDGHRNTLLLLIIIN